MQRGRSCCKDLERILEQSYLAGTKAFRKETHQLKIHSPGIRELGVHKCQDFSYLTLTDLLPPSAKPKWKLRARDPAPWE